MKGDTEGLIVVRLRPTFHMTKSEHRQQLTNNRSGATQAVVAEIDAIVAESVAATPAAQRVLTDEELADVAELEAPKARPQLWALAKDELEDIKENHTNYNKIGRAMREVDAHRKDEGRKAYNATRREEYAKAVGRPVRPYGVADSEQKRLARNAAKNAPRRAKLDAMTPEERKAYNAAEAARKRAARAAKNP